MVRANTHAGIVFRWRQDPESRAALARREIILDSTVSVLHVADLTDDGGLDSRWAVDMLRDDPAMDHTPVAPDMIRYEIGRAHV